MRKTTVKNLIHLLIISLPMLLLIIACIFPTKQINNTYALEETTSTQEIQYKYQTNELNSTNDFVDGNYYFISGLTGIMADGIIDYIEGYNIKVLYYYFEIDNSSLELNNGDLITNPIDIYFYNNGGSFSLRFYIDDGSYYYYNLYDLQAISYGELILQYTRTNIYIPQFFENSFTEGYLESNIPQWADKYLEPYETTTITNNTYNQETLTQFNETKQPNENILTPFKEFYALSINDWYRDVLNLLSINLQDTNIVKSYILYYPLWLMWFYLFELIEMIITAVPRIIIKITGKIGGGESV